MDYSAILTQLNLLPQTFLRFGTPFTWLQASKAAALLRYTGAVDALINQLNFSQAVGVWLDCWGKLFSIPRNSDETDNTYANRITALLTAGRGTPVGIQIYLLIALGITATVTEDFVNTAWQLKLSTPLTQAQLTQMIDNLVYVRPAGVPCLHAIANVQGGTYLGTVNFFGAARVTGAYLKTPVQNASTIGISATTNNSVPLLPTTFLSDPTLNPGL